MTVLGHEQGSLTKLIHKVLKSRFTCIFKVYVRIKMFLDNIINIGFEIEQLSHKHEVGLCAFFVVDDFDSFLRDVLPKNGCEKTVNLEWSKD